MFITSDEAQLLAVSFGSGSRTLLAFGGWVGNWELWAEPFTILSQTWRTVAYDHRGAGATICPLESITMTNMVNDVFAVMNALAIDQCVLAAESAGVAVALQAVLQHPERFTGLVIVDGAYYRLPQAGPSPFVQALRANHEATMKQFVNTCVPEPDNEAIKHWGRQIVMRSPQAAAIQLYEIMDGVDLRPQVHLVAVPTLICHGEADALVPLPDAQWLADQIPGSHLHVLPGAGHVPTMTRPHEIAAIINQFFDPTSIAH
ncbi:MAG: alpha/beta hydrolase [Chloroflexi bacterium]|nr:alpha/beta hydrolase [Chloroflexota bacterium]